MVRSGILVILHPLLGSSCRTLHRSTNTAGVFDGFHGDGPARDAAPLNLEGAWMLEERGALAAAARVAGYMYLGTPFLRAESTRHREAGRLWDAAGDVERAVERYRWYLGFRDLTDSDLHDEADAVRRRLAELEGRPAG